MNIINKDITTVDFGVIVHQVNCQGVMGSGVAKAIRDKWPKVFESYYNAYYSNLWSKFNTSLLGHVDICQVESDLYVANLFCQLDYRRGETINQRRFTNYGAWENALHKLKIQIDKINESKTEPSIYFPYNVGCDRGGGDFRIISAMIEEYFPDAIFCKI